MFISFNLYLTLIAPDTYRSATNPFEEYDNLGRTGKPRKPNMEMHPIYHPFGRSGGGAPVKDDAGKVNTILHGHSDVSIWVSTNNFFAKLSYITDSIFELNWKFTKVK